MARLRCTKRIPKWGGLMLTLVLASAWAVSFLLDFGYSSTRCLLQVRLVAGTCFVYRPDAPCIGDTLYVHIRSFSRKSANPEPVFSWVWCTWGSQTLPYRVNVGGEARNLSYSFFNVSLWIPFLLVAIPTVFIWWRDRRRIPPGHCQKCGYNLTGNISGVCPECGAEARSGQSSGVGGRSDGAKND